ncbi:hypothetical protein SIL73_14775 [Acidithiobacillus thiooxidans]|uniref:hypothetical protein n=1 Tax=Acidithiobacillus thiooxidans TaxID=930 RepID=UPI0029C1BE2B|nr:hypothetical protein [Acidithiobacillus thiooxidans]MDX5935929.1 hypothetical protein [Acidithiobacillus thiooxidans]
MAPEKQQVAVFAAAHGDEIPGVVRGVAPVGVQVLVLAAAAASPDVASPPAGGEGLPAVLPDWESRLYWVTA